MVRMKYLGLAIVSVGFAMFLSGCGAKAKNLASENRLNEAYFVNTSSDEEYGYQPEKALLLGGFLFGTDSQDYHYIYFNRLRGPSGQEVSVKRAGSCCGFKDEKLPFGGGMLDLYELTYEGLEKPVIVYVNLYRFEEPKAPQGFILL